MYEERVEGVEPEHVDAGEQPEPYRGDRFRDGEGVVGAVGLLVIHAVGRVVPYHERREHQRDGAHRAEHEVGSPPREPRDEFLGGRREDERPDPETH